MLYSCDLTGSYCRCPGQPQDLKELEGKEQVPLLRIPPEHQSGLVKLALLSGQVAVQLHTVMSAAAQKAGGGSVSAEHLGPISGLSRADLEKIVDAVVGLNFARVYSDADIEDFAKDVSESLQAAAPSGFPTTKDSIDQFRKRIEEFLSIDGITRSAKTEILRYAHERSVHSLRILTDIRPVFGDDVEKPPEAVVIMHTLKMAYHRAGRLDEAFFGMDESDLRHLKEAAVRAELKAKSIRTALAKARLKVVSEE